MEQVQVEIETPSIDPVAAAQLAFDNQPSAKSLEALDRAKAAATVAQALARKAAADAEAKARAEKLARLNLLRVKLTTGLDERLEERAQKIAGIMLECLPIVQQWLDTEFEASTSDYFEADSLATELGEPKPVGAPPLNSLALRSSQIIQSKMPDGVAPTALTAYAGSHWGV